MPTPALQSTGNSNVRGPKAKMLFLQSFLRKKGVSLGYVGRNHNLKDLKADAPCAVKLSTAQAWGPFQNGEAGHMIYPTPISYPYPTLPNPRLEPLGPLGFNRKLFEPGVGQGRVGVMWERTPATSGAILVHTGARGGALPRVRLLQGYIAHKKPPPPPRTAIGA